MGCLACASWRKRADLQPGAEPRQLPLHPHCPSLRFPFPLSFFIGYLLCPFSGWSEQQPRPRNICCWRLFPAIFVLTPHLSVCTSLIASRKNSAVAEEKEKRQRQSPSPGYYFGYTALPWQGRVSVHSSPLALPTV